MGIIDDSYIGDNDQWHMPLICLKAKNSKIENNTFFAGTWIRKGDKIGQFRIMEVMPELNFIEAECFGNASRGGFGTTGKS